MTSPVVRRMRLPADVSSPSEARDAVRAALTEAVGTAVLDEAVLLTSELCTNAVQHAGTELDLEIVTDPRSVTVTVMDLRTGPLTGTAAASATTSAGPAGPEEPGPDAAERPDKPGPDAAAGPDEPDPRGRGLLLVDRLAACWGTVHHPGGKGVWFRLDRDGAAGGPPRGRSAPRLRAPSFAALADLALTMERQRRRRDTPWRSWLTFLAEVSELLAQSLDVDLTLALIPRLVVPRLGTWCAVHLADEAGELKLGAAAHTDETALPELAGALDAALPQLLDALRVDAVVPLAAPVDGYAVALVARGQRLGTLAAGRRGEHRPDTEELTMVEELVMVEEVARRSALAIDNARIHADRRIVAEALQRSLLPPALPEVHGIDFGAEYVPSGSDVDVGGDFYDVVELPDRRWLVVVGDVSGKGVQAATVTGLVRDVTRVLVRDGRRLPEVLVRLNETLLERGGGRFCTLALAVLAPRPDGRLDVTMYLAGHDQPVLLRADGRTSHVGACGTALGLLSTISSPSAEQTLEPGDTLIFYPDGVTERRRGLELFGAERLRAHAAALAGFPAEVVAARLRATTLAFSTEVSRDDIAIFAVRNDGAR